MAGRKQIKFVFQIGYQPVDTSAIDFENSVVRSASELCGGCTVSHKVGYWTEDGASHAATFKGKLQTEHCFEVELTCELAKAERVYSAMQYGIAMAAAQHKIDTDWVHVTETEMTGRHFSVAQILNPTPSVAAE